MPEREDVIGNDQRAATQAVIAALRERRSVKAMRSDPVPPGIRGFLGSLDLDPLD